jgi:transcriptional regulator with XRE-family HTH domain
MLVRKLRLQRGWSQEQLAELTGLSVRTIQRVERGQKPGLETATSLASVFEVELSTFTIGDTSMENTVKLEKDEQEAIQFVKGIKEFYSHLFMFVIFAIALLVFKGPTEPLVMWGLLGWGIGVIIHGLVAFEKINFIGPGWEKKQVEKRLGRDL